MRRTPKPVRLEVCAACKADTTELACRMRDHTIEVGRLVDESDLDCDGCDSREHGPRFEAFAMPDFLD